MSPSFEPWHKTLIMGRSGCGKSYLCRRLQKMWPRRVIIDSLHEYDDESEIFSDFETFADRLTKAEKEKEQEFSLVFQFEPDDENVELIFNELIRIIYHFGNILLIIEEVQNYSTPNSMPHYLKTALLTGRHRNLSLMFTTQRPGFLNKAVVSQCQHVFCGTLIDKNDINYVAGFLKEFSEKLINLKDREFIYLNSNGISEIKNDE